MKAVMKIQNHYFKKVYTPFNQPLLTSNGTMGGNSFAVSGSTSGGDVNGAPWQAFATEKGYSGSLYYVYVKGGRPSIYLNMYTPKPTVITGYSVFLPQYKGFWGRGTNNILYGSNTNGNWEQINFQAYIANNTQNVITFENQKVYKYYRFQTTCEGGNGRDGISLSSFRLIGNECTDVEVAEGEEYDYIIKEKKFKTILNKQNFYGIKL